MNSFSLTLFTLLGLYLIKLLVMELIVLIRIAGYRMKGLKHADYKFWPLAMIQFKKTIKGNDIYKNAKKKLYEAEDEQPFHVFGIDGSCHFLLLSHEAISEFYKNETKFTEKVNYFAKLKFLAFFFQNGKKVHQARATFSKIFHYSNVISLMPQIHQSIKTHVKALKKRVSQAKDRRLKINIKQEFLLDLLEDLTGCILLTGADKRISATFDGMTISQILKKMYDCFDAHPRQILTWIPFSERLGLSKTANEFKRLQDGFRKIIADQYKERYNSASEEDLAENSILDIMVKLNKKSERETGQPQFTLEEISDNFELFQFAGSDTSFQASCSLLTYLAHPENQVYQERLSSELNSEYLKLKDLNNDKLNSLKMLDMCFRETMRMANPAVQISPRKVVKNFKLCGYELKKGDLVRNSLVGYQPAFFKEPYKFLPDRFSEEARKKIPFTKQLPFSHGQRGCIGKYLGEMMVKLIGLELVKNFKFEVEEGYVMKMGLNPIYGVANPELILSIRKD